MAFKGIQTINKRQRWYSWLEVLLRMRKVEYAPDIALNVTGPSKFS